MYYLCKMLMQVIIAALVTYIVILHRRYRKVTNPHVDFLKNALLSYALSQVKKDDFDHFNFAYQTFDGTKLPSMSGYDTVNACASYIIDKKMFRKGPFYTTHMESKLDAIDKYLDAQFDSNDKVTNFLELLVNQKISDKE